MFPATGQKNIAASIQTVHVRDCSSTEPLYQSLVETTGMDNFCRVDVTLSETETVVKVAIPSPAEIVFNINTVKAVTSIFADVQIDPRIKEAKARAKKKVAAQTKKKVAAARRVGKNLIIDADLRAPVFILPSDCNNAKSSVIFVDLGSLVLAGRRFPKETPESDSLLRDQLPEVTEFSQETLFTEHFRVQLSQLQALVTETGVADVHALLMTGPDDARRCLKRVDIVCMADMGSMPHKRSLVDCRASAIELAVSPPQIEALLAFKSQLQSHKKPARVKSGAAARVQGQAQAASTESSKAFFFVCPELRATLLNGPGEVMWTAGLGDLRVGAAIAGTKDLRSTVKLNTVHIRSAENLDGDGHVTVLETAPQSSDDFIQLQVSKTSSETNVDLNVDGLSLGFYPASFSNVHKLISAIDRPEPVSRGDIIIAPAATAAGAAATPTAGAQNGAAAPKKRLHLTAALSALTVDFAAIDSNEIVYVAGLEKCTATIDKGQAGCALRVQSSVGKVLVKDMSSPLWPQILSLASGAVAYEKYDTRVAKVGHTQPLDSNLEVDLGEAVLAVNPKNIKALVRHQPRWCICFRSRSDAC